MEQKKQYSATIFGAWILTIVSIVVGFSGMLKSFEIATIIAIVAVVLFGLISIKSPKSSSNIIDESDNTMVILGDPNGYEVSAQEAFGYTYSITQPELWFGWNDTEYISNKLSSHNMYVRVPKKYIK